VSSTPLNVSKTVNAPVVAFTAGIVSEVSGQA
jgi:hypothetical protein